MCMHVQSSLTLCDPMNCNLPGSSVQWIFQARILERFAIPSPGDLPDPGTDPMDCSSPGSSVHGILQARILERVGIPFSRESF